MKYWVIIKDNYVINKVVWDGETEWTYPFPHDMILEDETGGPGIGDWYEETENLFYRPLGTPPDWPDQLQPPTTEPEQEGEESGLDNNLADEPGTI